MLEKCLRMHMARIPQRWRFLCETGDGSGVSGEDGPVRVLLRFQRHNGAPLALIELVGIMRSLHHAASAIGKIPESRWARSMSRRTSHARFDSAEQPVSQVSVALLHVAFDGPDQRGEGHGGGRQAARCEKDEPIVQAQPRGAERDHHKLTASQPGFELNGGCRTEGVGIGYERARRSEVFHKDRRDQVAAARINAAVARKQLRPRGGIGRPANGYPSRSATEIVSWASSGCPALQKNTNSWRPTGSTRRPGASIR